MPVHSPLAPCPASLWEVPLSHSPLPLFVHLSSFWEPSSQVSCSPVVLHGFLASVLLLLLQQCCPSLPFLSCRALSSFQAQLRGLLLWGTFPNCPSPFPSLWLPGPAPRTPWGQRAQLRWSWEVPAPQPSFRKPPLVHTPCTL